MLHEIRLVDIWRWSGKHNYNNYTRNNNNNINISRTKMNLLCRAENYIVRRVSIWYWPPCHIAYEQNICLSCSTFTLASLSMVRYARWGLRNEEYGNQIHFVCCLYIPKWCLAVGYVWFLIFDMGEVSSEHVEEKYIYLMQYADEFRVLISNAIYLYECYLRKQFVYVWCNGSKRINKLGRSTKLIRGCWIFFFL